MEPLGTGCVLVTTEGRSRRYASIALRLTLVLTRINSSRAGKSANRARPLSPTFVSLKSRTWTSGKSANKARPSSVREVPASETTTMSDSHTPCPPRASMRFQASRALAVRGDFAMTEFASPGFRRISPRRWFLCRPLNPRPRAGVEGDLNPGRCLANTGYGQWLPRFTSPRAKMLAT